MDKVAVFNIYEEREFSGSNPASSTQYILRNQRVFFIFPYSVLQGNNFLAGYFYIFELFFYSGISAGTAAFPSNKKEEFTCYIHEYVAKVEPISSLLMHNLLEILHTL